MRGFEVFFVVAIRVVKPDKIDHKTRTRRPIPRVEPTPDHHLFLKNQLEPKPKIRAQRLRPELRRASTVVKKEIPISGQIRKRGVALYTGW